MPGRLAQMLCRWEVDDTDRAAADKKLRDRAARHPVGDEVRVRFADRVIASDRAERVDGDAAVSDHDDHTSIATFEVDECGNEAVRCVDRGIANRRVVRAIIRRPLPLGHELIETDARTVIPVHALPKTGVRHQLKAKDRGNRVSRLLRPSERAGNNRLDLGAVLAQPHRDDRRLPMLCEARIASRPDFLPMLNYKYLDAHPGTLRPLFSSKRRFPGVPPNSGSVTRLRDARLGPHSVTIGDDGTVIMGDRYRAAPGTDRGCVGRTYWALGLSTSGCCPYHVPSYLAHG